jgi:hypothetical protein
MNDFHMLLVCQFYLLVRRAKMVHPVSLRVMYIDVMAGARLMGDVVGIRRQKKKSNGQGEGAYQQKILQDEKMATAF